ncbi:hypothetical protein, partial [Enterobacter cloacae]|uniref:hypothetical protein n=1 Tax=Enterobacter cloacae TaxID=550 RepID=UPI0039C1BE2D
TVCVVGKMRDLILQLSKSSIYSTKSLSRDDKSYLTLDDMNAEIDIKASEGLVNKEVEMFFQANYNEKIRSLFK